MQYFRYLQRYSLAAYQPERTREHKNRYDHSTALFHNLEIATSKTKVLGFAGTDHLRVKIIIYDETPDQVSQFTYLGCSTSYQVNNDVELKLAQFLQLIVTINLLAPEFFLIF
jgi:hypothetical protein